MIDCRMVRRPHEGWWATIGAWEPSVDPICPRTEVCVLEDPRQAGMIPGLWLSEIDVA